MSLRDGGFGELKVPLTWTAAVALIVAAVVAVAALLTDRRETFQAEAYGVTRQVNDAVTAPVTGAMAAPIRWTGTGVDAVRGYFFAVSENRRLKRELVEMARWRDEARLLRDTNDRYKTLLGLKTEPPIPMVAARVISDARGPFARTRLANAGTERGVKPGHPVMSENGLVGRVIGVTQGVSRVLLLTDVASRTPVMVDRTNARAILTGDGGDNPKLEYLRGENPIREGDRLLTSGDGGVLPRGLPVGTAVKGVDGRWRVSLSSDAAPIDYVRILLFEDFGQLANLEALNKPVPPPMAGAPTMGVAVTAPATGAAAPAGGSAPAATAAASSPAPATATAPRAATPGSPPAGATPAPRPTAPAARPPTPRPAPTTPQAAAPRPPAPRPAPATPPAAPAPTPASQATPPMGG